MYKIRVGNHCYNLKKKREHILVKNTDGQTSFLNEIQRRKNFYEYKSIEPEKFSHIVHTIYASLHQGFILSEWIDGDIISRFDKEIIRDIFKTHIEIEKKGLFECDLSKNNLLINKDKQIMFFDFGYMYPYNPLIHYNSDGKQLPIFHLCERLESRSLMQYLMDIENDSSLMIETFENTKRLALEAYSEKLIWLEKNNADTDVIQWQKNWINQWEYSLKSPANLLETYELESFRSYVLDVHDDIGGKSCTPMTIKKLDKILEQIKHNYPTLKIRNGLFWGDEKLNNSSLYDKYTKLKEQACRYQLHET